MSERNFSKDREFGYYTEEGNALGYLVDNKQKAYGNAMRIVEEAMFVFLQRYKDGDNYVIPKELIPHMLVMVRIMDKQCRIFSNPAYDLMGESPYNDIAGYSLLSCNIRKSKE